LAHPLLFVVDGDRAFGYCRSVIRPTPFDLFEVRKEKHMKSGKEKSDKTSGLQTIGGTAAGAAVGTLWDQSEPPLARWWAVSLVPMPVKLQNPNR
jgi:hypothetical protein